MLAGVLGEHRETGPATSASTSTFSTVASISGKSLNLSKSVCTRKSVICCVDNTKLVGIMADSCSQGHWECARKLDLLLRPLTALSQQLRRYQESR